MGVRIDFHSLTCGGKNLNAHCPLRLSFSKGLPTILPLGLVLARFHFHRNRLHSVQSTHRFDYLDEEFTAHRDLQCGPSKIPALNIIHYQVGQRLLQTLVSHRKLFHHLWQDFEEIMQFFPKLVDDVSVEVFYRFNISHGWASTACRGHAHFATPTMYETVMSLLKETLLFFPTLQIQHFPLAHGS